MTEKILKVFRVESVDLEALRTALRDDRLHWFYGERMENVHLGWLAELLEGQGQVPLDRFVTGRAFGPGIEVSWWKEGSNYRLRTILESGSLPGELDWKKATAPTLKSLPGDEHQLVLWGTYDDELGAWAEARIPRPLPHPTSWEGNPPKQAALLVRDYRRDGAVVLTRFLKVEPY